MFSRSAKMIGLVTIGITALHLGGCSSAPTSASQVPARVAPDVQTLTVGDTIRISFPGAPNLDTTQQIRRDGRINLYLIGEVKAADKTPAEFEKELLKAYESQLTSKEIKVTVVSSAFAVYVMGAVTKPGKITSDRALTAFDAVMEAGGFTMTTADTKNVRVIRQEDGQTKTFPLNMKAVLEGAPTEAFYLKTYDVVYVPEKFSWF
jgi:polysaccharide biosynthesis/export protein